MEESYPVLTMSAASRRLDELREDPLYPHHQRSDLNAVENRHARRMVDALDAVRSSMGRHRRGFRFDRFAAPLLHSFNRELPTHMQEDAGFWRWVAIEHGADIVEHRYGGSARAGRSNFGLGDRWESMFRRLWFRGDVSHDIEARNPYHLTVLGDVDFWASGVFRHQYGSSRNLAKAFIQFAYDNPTTPEQDRWQRAGESDRDKGIRILYKNLSRLHATVAYEVLTVEQCTEILKRLSKGLPRTSS